MVEEVSGMEALGLMWKEKGDGSGAAGRPGAGQEPGRKLFPPERDAGIAVPLDDAGKGRSHDLCREEAIACRVWPEAFGEMERAFGGQGGRGKGTPVRQTKEAPSRSHLPAICRAMMPSGGRRG